MGLFSDIVGGIKDVVGIGSGVASIASNFGNESNLNTAMQKEFAQQGVRWRVEDAKAAGVHPLFALGAQVPSFSPVLDVGSNRLSDLAASGQDLSRALAATQTRHDREQSALAAAQLARTEAETQLVQAQIAKLNSGQVGPPLPLKESVMIGPGESAPVIPVQREPLELAPFERGNTSKEVGSLSDYTFVRQADGGLRIVPSRDIKQRIEDTAIPELLWALNNNLLPNLESAYFYPQEDPGPGRKWQWSFRRQAFYSVPMKGADAMDFWSRPSWRELFSVPGFKLQRRNE